MRVIAVSLLVAIPFLTRLAGPITADPPATSALVTDEPACNMATLVSTGGQFPRNPHTLAVRWTGFSNFELVYGSQVILLDAYFDRGGTYRT